MLRTQFEEELLNLHNQFYEMGMLVSSAIHKSVRAYVRHDNPSRSQRFGSKAKRGSPKSKKKSQICRITSKKWLIMS